MTYSTQYNPAKFKFIFYVLIALIILLVIGTFLRYRILSGVSSPGSSSDPNATASLDQVDHTAMKEGVKQWSLKAETVNYYQDDNLALFDVLTLVMFSENRPPTTLTSDTGKMNTETNDIWAFGHVVVVNGPYTLESESLHYNDKDRIITSPVPVRVTNEGSKITADTMTMNMDTTVTVFEGHVKGVFREAL